jgi:peptide/nickel transport system permease protein
MSETTAIRPPRNQWWDVWDQFKTHKGALFGAFVLFSILALVIVGPWVWTVDAKFINIRARDQGMSLTYPLGTDQLGRDMLTRMIWGTRNTIAIATAATMLSFSLGAILGFTAAVYGGWVDQVLARFNDLVMSIPTLIFALVVLSVMPVTIPVLIVVMGLLDSTRVFRLSRAVAVDINVMDYVEAARLRGEGQRWVIFREILPNALSPLVAELGLRFIFAILFISTLSFLGLGLPPRDPDWGGIVRDNRDGIVYGIPAALIPAVAIVTLSISVNLVADWALNRTTSLKGGRG